MKYLENNIKGYTLYRDDCYAILSDLVDRGVKVDLTVTSPPYDDIRCYNNTLYWNFESFKDIANKLWEVTKDGGVVVWVVGDRVKNGSESGTSFKQALYFMDIGFKLHDTMIYAKNNPIPMNHNRYEQCFEYMFILVKGKLKTFNGIKELCKYGGTLNSSGTFRNRGIEDSTANSSNILCGGKEVKLKKLKTNIWKYSVGNNQSTKDRIAFKHPAIFPEKLAEDHIITWSNEGDLVLDPFMGSGTTGKMCCKLNRKFIGIEKVDEYFNIALERLNY